MDRTIENALDDISLIKAVIVRTQKDFAKVAKFFICIGVVNGIAWIIEETAYFIRSFVGDGSWIVQFLGQGYRLLRFVGYISLFIIYYKKIKATNNDISEGMIKIWGMVLIGSYVLSFLYIRLLPIGNDDRLIALWRCRELIEVLPVIFALFMTGILTKRIIITACTSLYSILYFVLFASMKEITYGNFGGQGGAQMPLSSISVKCIMILGMFFLGWYLKIGAKEHGD
ncbi:hypothetical protein [Butyrivibrio sp. AE2005]|uniref:hypothetical protein n=1 Tax=Butyrivibrio sp. AE2005 TaxID=1496722 RepID=UPI00047A77E3|nr:hypothetical protein [Butyrivibrio sp. AE2005]